MIPDPEGRECRDVKAMPAAEAELSDIWAGYDAEKARGVLRESAGVLAGIDREALLADIHAAREQASHGRPA